jgi:hypothetical protein
MPWTLGDFNAETIHATSIFVNGDEVVTETDLTALEARVTALETAALGFVKIADFTALDARVVVLETASGSSGGGVTLGDSSGDGISQGDDAITEGDGGSGVITLTPTKAFDFRSASLSGTTISFDTGDTATLTGTGATLSATDGVSTTSSSSCSLLPSAWSISTSFSIEVYFKMESGGSYTGVFNCWDGGASAGNSATNVIGIERSQSSNGIQFFTRNTGNSDEHIVRTGSVSGMDGTWGHVVLTHEDGVGKAIYVDGVQLNGLTTTTATSLSIQSGVRDTYNIGSPTPWDNDSTSESVRFLNYYDTVLSASQVSTLYSALSVL